MEEIEADIVPFGFIDDGVEETEDLPENSWSLDGDIEVKYDPNHINF